jgi:hypothetical protein
LNERASMLRYTYIACVVIHIILFLIIFIFIQNYSLSTLRNFIHI